MSGETAQRKLTTILAADVVGYSRMMAAGEEATYETLKAYRAVTDAIVAKHNGRVFSTAGDAFLAEFGSPVEAVRCAITIQEDLAVRNADLPEESQMWFRIGINLGDVMIGDSDLFGDGVNVAARLEGLAEKGGICISGSTFDQVKNKLSIGFDDIGAQHVKNIPEPVPAFRLVPGKVSLAPDPAKSAAAPPARSRSRLVVGAGAAVLVAVLAAAYLAGLLGPEPRAATPFDGDWRVTVDSLSGCLNNAPKSYPVRISGGRIDEPQELFPKTGSVTGDGRLTIRVTDKKGRFRNTQVAQLTRDVGAGEFRGAHAGCTGKVTLARVK